MITIGQALPPLPIERDGAPMTTAALRSRQNLLFLPCAPRCEICAACFAQWAADETLTYWEIDRWWVLDAAPAPPPPAAVPPRLVLTDTQGRLRAWLEPPARAALIALFAPGMEAQALLPVAAHRFPALASLAALAADEALRCPE